MEGFKVSDFRLITSFAECFETVGDELADTAAEDCLFTEEVRFRFFLEGRLDDAGTRTADATGISQGEVEAFSGSILFNSEYVGDAAASTNVRRTRWPGPFGATMKTSTSAGGTICLK